MSSLRLRERRNRWSQGRDGLWETEKDEDAVERHVVDWRAELEAGENISDVTWSADSGGVVVTSGALEGNRSTLLISKSGIVKGVATTSTGRTLLRRLRFISQDE